MIESHTYTYLLVLHILVFKNTFHDFTRIISTNTKTEVQFLKIRLVHIIYMLRFVRSRKN